MANRKGGRRCCVPACSSSTYRNPNVSFSQFPRNETLRNRWIKIINDNAKTVQSETSEKRPWSTTVRKVLGSKHQSVCGRHFNLNGKKAYSDKIPKYFYHEGSYKQCDFIPERFIDVSNYIDVSSTTVHEEEPLHLPTDIARKLIISDSNSTEDHNYGIKQDYGELAKRIKEQRGSIEMLMLMVENLNEIKRENLSLKQEKKDYEKRMSQLSEAVRNFDLLRKVNSKLKENLASLKNENSKLKQEIVSIKKKANEKGTKFSLTHIKSSAMLNFYTGFKSMQDFNGLFEYLEPDLSTLNFNCRGSYERKTERKSTNNQGRPIALDFKNQLFLVLCRLKVGLFEEDLAYRFEISQSTVSVICITWFDLLDKRLSCLKIWPSRKLVDDDMPDAFQSTYPSTRVITDCQSDTSSSYKSNNTSKGLIGISPNGLVSFVSKLSPGQMSGLEITDRRGIVDFLEPGDSVMADRGFTIGDLLKENRVGLNIPPFLGKKNQLSLEEEGKTRDIDVERIIKGVKKYHILKIVFPNKMHTQHEKVWKICAYLTNFCTEPLIKVENSEL